MKEFYKLKDTILKELNSVLGQIPEKQREGFINSILSADRVFFIGVGRVLLMSRAFAKRLIHLGVQSYIVGDTTTPGIKEGDLLIASSGSGETMTTVNIARLAKGYGAKIALITAHIRSTLGKMADCVVKIPCPTKLHLKGEYRSIQPMSNLFEQSLLIFFDCISIIIQEKLGIKEKQMWQVHANLE